MTSPAPLPSRLRLDVRQLAGALQLAGIRPSPQSGLPEVPPGRQPARALAGTAALAPNGQQLTPEADHVLRVAAAPTRVLLVLSARAGVNETTSTSFLRAAPDGPFVAQARTGDVYDFALIPSVDHALVVVDDLLGLSALAAMSGTPPLEVDLAGYVALLAAADCAQAARLQARLGRQVGGPVPPFTGAHLEQQLALGTQAADTRWAVSAARLVSPVAFQAGTGRLDLGAQGLTAAGVLRAGPDGYTFTDRGLAFAEPLGQLVKVGALSAGVVTGDDRFVVGHVSILRAATSIWVAAWRRRTPNDAAIHLAQTPLAGALRLVQGLLEAREPPAPSGGTPAVATMALPDPTTAQATTYPPAGVQPDAAQPVAPQPTSVPETLPTAAGGVWAPTHTVPASGLTAWQSPDPSSPSVALAAGLPVQLVERYGDYVRVMCDNGFSAWVDGRQLP